MIAYFVRFSFEGFAGNAQVLLDQEITKFEHVQSLAQRIAASNKLSAPVLIDWYTRLPGDDTA